MWVAGWPLWWICVRSFWSIVVYLLMGYISYKPILWWSGLRTWNICVLMTCFGVRNVGTLDHATLEVSAKLKKRLHQSIVSDCHTLESSNLAGKLRLFRMGTSSTLLGTWLLISIPKQHAPIHIHQTQQTQYAHKNAVNRCKYINDCVRQNTIHFISDWGKPVPGTS